MPDWLVFVGVVFAALVVAGCVAVLAMIAWWFYQLAQNERRFREEGAPPPEPPPSLDEMDDEEKVAHLEHVLASGQTHGERIKEQWAAERRAAGWEEEQIQQHLRERPLLELN